MSPELYKASMEQWFDLLADDATDMQSARDLISKQWSFMQSRAAAKDVTFFLFHGSSNFISAVLTKVAANITA